LPVLEFARKRGGMSRLFLCLLSCAAALAACDRAAGPVAAGGKASAAFDTERLEGAIDRRFGGVGACVLVQETSSGDTVYQYGSHTLCRTQQPPCATFEIPLSLIALESGAVRPDQVLEWNGAAQPARALERDADLRTAFTQSIPWWFAAVAQRLGAERLQRALDGFDYGNERVEGPVDRFWTGAAAGGRLAISTQQQAAFLRRFFGGRLGDPQAAGTVRQLMAAEAAGGAVVSGKSAACASAADNSRQVAWWVGRLQAPGKDYVFAISMEGANDNVLPGRELALRGQAAFTEAGLLPSG
jgi:beta-lactamase class D